MPYTNGIFYIDPATGSNTARTALTGCVASNPAGTTTRINKTAHGLVTGAVVDLTLFSAWLNGAWKITVVDADNFDLDTAVWQTTADANGTVTPRGGSSWSDAWQTVAAGATAARIQPGDEMRFPVTAEVGTGVNATFTNNSKDITLASALTKTIQHASTSAGWVGSANITVNETGTRKIGGNSVTLTPATAFTTGMVVYAPVEGSGAQDFSAYTKISFWFRALSNSSFAANTFRIRLCSDTAGVTTVDSFTLAEATLNNTNFQSFVIDKGSALGSSIQSVAIDCLIDPGTVGFTFHNIVACNDVTHNSIIGPENDCMYCIQSFDGTTISVDGANTAAAGQGWSGTAGTYELYYISPYVSNSTASVIAPTEAGSVSAINRYVGGFDTGTNTVTGRTCFLAAGFSGVGITGTSREYSNFENLGFFRFSTPLTTGHSQTYTNCIFSNGSSSSTILSEINSYDCFFLNSPSSLINFGSTGGNAFFQNCVFANTSTASVTTSRLAFFYNCIFRNNTQSIAFNAGSAGFMRKGTRMYKCLLSDSTEFAAGAGENGILWSYEHDQTAGNHWGFTNGGTINWQTTEKQGSDPGAWRVVHSSSARTSNFPIRFEVAQIAVAASSLVTVDVWVKKDHATDVGCKIFVEGADYTLTGIVADSDTAADNTSWQELTITFTPSVAGIVPIWFESFYIAGNSNTYLGSITVTQ